MDETPKTKDDEKKCLFTVIMVILVLGFSTVYGSESFEVEVVATVYKIIDGDTFDAFPVGRVRLADVNAPELDEVGGAEAKQALASLIQDKIVYLDVDDRYVMDRYYRLVCVVYVRADSERLLNVNKFLLDNKYVYLADFENEFNPSLWNLYEYYQEPIKETLTVTRSQTVTFTETLSVTVVSYGQPTVTETITSTIFSTVTQFDSTGMFSTRNIILLLIIVIFLLILLSILFRRKLFTFL